MSDKFTTASPEQRPDILRAATDPVAATHFAAQRHSADWVPNSDLTIPELSSCAVMMMVKDENDILAENLNHHYSLGFRRFFILDNGSTDGTSDRIIAFRAARPDAIVFSAYDPVAGYYQQTKMNALQAFAQDYLSQEDPPIDWVFFVDADEFITCCSADGEQARLAFRAVLANPDKKMMIFHWVQCASQRPIVGIRGDYDLPSDFDLVWHNLSPTVPKVAFRTNHGLRITQGNHTLTAYPFEVHQSAVMAEAHFYMLHYPMRSIDQLRTKIVNGGLAYEAAKGLNPDFGGHWKTYYRWLRQHGDGVLLHLIQQHISSCTTTGETPTKAGAWQDLIQGSKK